MRRFARFVLLTSFLTTPLTCLGATYYVSPTGSDTAAGGITTPWRTLNRALNTQRNRTTVRAGDIVMMRGGNYAEIVNVGLSGTPSAPITVQAYPGETPVLNGTGVTLGSFETGGIICDGVTDLIFDGLEIANYTTTSSASDPAGIWISGGSNNSQCARITIRNCHIHHIGSYDTYDPTIPDDTVYGNAHAIAVYGNRTTPLDGVVIENCHIHDIAPLYSEVISINSNVTNFKILNCEIHDCNNIAIDIIGHEGSILANDAINYARGGLIKGNKVYNISAYTNPAYIFENGGVPTYGAGGIYCDGAGDVDDGAAGAIIIENNLVYNCDIGIELSSERAGFNTENIIMRGNILRNNLIGGLFVGNDYNDGEAYERGGTSGCSITNNTFYANDTLTQGNGEIIVRNQTSGLVFKNNIFYTPRYTSPNFQTLFINETEIYLTPPTAPIPNVYNYNVYYMPGINVSNTSVFFLQGSSRRFGTWQSAGRDVNSRFVDPLFVSVANRDFHLQLTSPAIDGADPTTLPGVTEMDFDGKERLTGSRMDVGADELSGYDAWRKSKFTTSPAGSNTLPLVDADNDGVLNLLEYAFGGEPLDKKSIGTQLPQLGTTTVSNQIYTTLSYTTPLSAVGLTFSIEGSNDLASWTDTTEVVVSSSTNTTGQTVTLRESTPQSTTPRRFLRLVVSQN